MPQLTIDNANLHVLKNQLIEIDIWRHERKQLLHSDDTGVFIDRQWDESNNRAVELLEFLAELTRDIIPIADPRRGA